MLFRLSSENTVLLYVFCFLLIVVFLALKFLLREKLGKFPYTAKESLLSKTEFDFYKQLQQALKGTEYTIQIKVGIQDIVHIPRDTEKYIVWLNKINKKHVDFLICDKNLKPIRAIELDDKTHSLPSRIERDMFVDEVFKSVSIPLEHINVSSRYNLDHLKKLIN
jgi:hypothetical protein